MEEYLPLIIGIVWLVYTIYNKGKKRGAKPPHPEAAQETPISSFFEQLFTDKETLKPQPYGLYESDEENLPVEEYEQVAYEPEEKSSPFLKTELADFMYEGQPATETSDNHLMEENEDEENQFNRTDFDLRKAIIFSEILNAPYIGYK
jgi:hypothetical protein